jgi:glutamyl-tRNA reductase
MRLKDFRVVHLLKKDAPVATPSYAAPLGGFVLDSCQRWVWVYPNSAEFAPELGSQARYFSGEAAYLFLLRVAAGLESEVKGETDVLGQIKDAWRDSDSPELSTWMQRLFEDARDVRANCLQGIGGASYGSLARKFLPASGPILIVGAGQMARSVATLLMDRELWITNRSPERLLEFHGLLRSKGAENVRVIEKGKEESAWSSAAAVVVCVPNAKIRNVKCPVVHLGVLRQHAGAWTKIPSFHSLDDLFELQKSQNALRSTQIERAERACEERAKLRALGGGLNIAHGWEDLVLFG